MSVQNNLIRLQTILAGGSKKAPELQQALGISQPTLSRLIQSAGASISSFGSTRSTLYALPRTIPGIGSEVPVYQIDVKGNARRYGVLSCLAGPQYYWQPAEGSGRLYDHLPWFIQNVRPEGFLGRSFAKKYRHQGFPERLDYWNDDHILMALSTHGHDLPGNLIIGDQSFENYFVMTKNGHPKIAMQDRETAYPQMALDAMAGNPPGSSAGGEQPKFTATIEDEQTRHVIVKFSSRSTSVEGQRWSDLLVCEHLALQTLREAGHRAALSDLFFFDQRCFLEVQRFDRADEFGRQAVATLAILDDEFFGERDHWAGAAKRLERQGMIGRDDANAIRFQSAFGKMIADTDQHFGNISLFIGDDGRFAVAPAYDVLPMFYRPAATGEVIDQYYEPPVPVADLAGVWKEAQDCATRFWEKVSQDQRVSGSFRALAERHAEDLEQDHRPRLIR